MSNPVPDRLRTTLLTLVVPVALLAAATAVALSWADDLPDPVAVHWGTDGPDGFGSLASAIWPMLLTGVVTSVGAWALAFWAGRASATRRIATGTSVGLAAFLGCIMVGSLAGQRGLADAVDAGGFGPTLLVAVIAGLVLGVAAAALVRTDRPQPTTARVDRDAPRLDLGDSERAVWRRSVHSRPTLVVGTVAVLAVLVATVLTRMWALGLLAVLLAALLCSMVAFDATVDERGLDVRSLLGWPRVRVPLDEVERAVARQVEPISEFGGWGYRVGRGGRTGIVLRKGDGLEVHRTGGRILVVTVDDAATAAALLNALADRSRAV
ncbi:DUF1648 domain-containing protein [Cellulomonas sp. HZM]|uniref:DUF1648 domain-containing protein n=1 Tax=Cellulomonas sp. HZM TaxID=1454010 RepID=UPI000493819E|nr:DUF1648 domain-containing protein [Cellulomonas sp. HZM]